MSPLSQRNSLPGALCSGKRQRDGERGSPAGSSPFSLPLPCPASAPLHRSPQSASHIPRASRDPRRVTFLSSLLVQAFLLSHVDSCNKLLTHLPASFSSLPRLPPPPPPRPQAVRVSDHAALHAVQIEKGRLFSRAFETPCSLLSITLWAPLLTMPLHVPCVLTKLK